MSDEGTRGRGRPPGVPNKVTASVKAALEQVFEKRGGIDAMVTWADENETEFYKLYAKLLPVQVQADMKHTGAVKIIVETGVPRAPDDPAGDDNPDDE